MNRFNLDKRLRDLGIYSDFYFRKELKPLTQVLRDDEMLNCVLTGVHEANRKMLAVTDRRLIIIFAGALADKAFTVIRRSAVKEYHFEKKFLFSKLSILTNSGDEFVFTNTQGSVKDLFDWAMRQPIPEGE
ncbi:MAG: PH domain-containing protein [Oscillospiraceae bacterium]|nr:PH domain-containing protein [Oscillospiraceae bacterium]